MTRAEDVTVPLTGYLAPLDLEHELRDEMAAAGVRAARPPHGRLVLSADAPIDARWVANVWHDVEEIPKELKRKLTFIPVKSMREVLDAAFEFSAPLTERLG